MSFLKLLLPLSIKKRKDLEQLREYLEHSDFKKVKKILKLGKIGVAYSSLKVSEKLIEDKQFPIINLGIEEEGLTNITNVWNDIIEQKVREKKYEEFSLVAEQRIKEFLAPHIVGLDEVKEAAILQLFSTDKVHVLLLGDPSTGKTDILRAIDDIAPISSYGLGSGTSAAGLTATFKGDQLIKGLLTMADEGICCVDELNLMRPRDRGALLNAMEKGFITYDKGSKHIKLDARISLLATANPKGDQFVGRTPDTWMKQIPFDPALLSRFHLVFFVRRPGTKEFVDIAKKIVSEREKNLEINDSLFLRDYVEFSQFVDVAFDEKLKKQIVDFSAKLKKDEKNFLVEISPRLILGIMRLAKASARMELRRVVEQKDLNKVFKLYEKSLYIK
ncbi:MAG: ATP-binding protein [Nanoarchaeota archaeon]|nr:ATP-binding protein [DPANN group archaeon]MBL7116357.1 ATP-binding protein [Nanoarchaeota archaeon]